MRPANPWLIAAGWGSVGASLVHIACIIGGPDWYRFFGAGEEIARAAERGLWFPAIITLFIAAVLAVWALFAFSAAGKLRRLPLTRTALVAISAVLLLRASFYLFPATWGPELTHIFMLISSLVVLALGLCFAIGTWRAWTLLSTKPNAPTKDVSHDHP